MGLRHSSSSTHVKEFLKEIREMYQSYPKGNISNEEISNHTVSWFVLDDERYKELIKVDFRIKELRAGMDFTSPSITEERKKLIAKELIKRIDEILN